MNITLDVGVLHGSLLKMAVVKRVITFAGLVQLGLGGEISHPEVI